MNELKLNNLSRNNLSRVNGGGCTVTRGNMVTTMACGCACAYENSGGSSSANNRDANYAKGLCSPCIVDGTCQGFAARDVSSTLH